MVDGGSLLGGEDGGSPPYCVVLASGARRCGLLVHSVRSRRDVVVKGLDDILGQQNFISGVTTLGDGRVVFILDVAALTSVRSEGAFAAEGTDA
jgi:chemotaxis protein histidine kinase CheA